MDWFNDHAAAEPAHLFPRRLLQTIRLSFAGLLFCTMTACALKESKEQTFYKTAALQQKFSLRELFPAGKYCVLPGGELPEGWMLMHFPQIKARSERLYDSQDDWFIVLIFEDLKTAEIIAVQYQNADLKNEESICSFEIAIIVDESKAIHAEAR
jgi:hypothetical protein